MKKELLKLIIDRKASIQRVIDLLEQNWGKINWAANRGNEDLTTGLIPKRGFLDKDQKIRYNFHGAGILVVFEDESVNFNFNFCSFDYSEADHTGINYDRVFEYLHFHKGKYSELEKFYSSERVFYEEKVRKIQYLLKELELENVIHYDLATDKYFLSL